MIYIPYIYKQYKYILILPIYAYITYMHTYTFSVVFTNMPYLLY